MDPSQRDDATPMVTIAPPTRTGYSWPCRAPHITNIIINLFQKQYRTCLPYAGAWLASLVPTIDSTQIVSLDLSNPYPLLLDLALSSDYRPPAPSSPLACNLHAAQHLAGHIVKRPGGYLFLVGLKHWSNSTSTDLLTFFMDFTAPPFPIRPSLDMNMHD